MTVAVLLLGVTVLVVAVLLLAVLLLAVLVVSVLLLAVLGVAIRLLLGGLDLLGGLLSGGGAVERTDKLGLQQKYC